jgi:hypothetical protein
MQSNKVEKTNVYARRSLPVSTESLNEARSLRARYVAGLIAELRNVVVRYLRALQPFSHNGKSAAAKT